MEKYGYTGEDMVDPTMAALTRTDPDMAMRMGLMMFQSKWEMYGLNATGELDEPTKALMAMDRCEMPDIQIMEDMPSMDMDGMMGEEGALRRRRRYATVGKCRLYAFQWMILGYFGLCTATC